MGNVVVTGASGFIGRSCVTHLRQKGFCVLVAGRQKDADIYCDLNQLDSVLSLHEVKDIDIFIHLGALVGWSGASLGDMYAPNVLATALIAELVRSRGAFLLFSSAAIVSGLHNEEISDNSPLNVDTPYGQSKALAEACIEASCVNACILRIGGVFGLHGPQHLGINRAISRALAGISPELYGNGSGCRNYIYVHDLARIIINTIEERKIGIYCVGGPKALSINEMLNNVCEAFGIVAGPTKKFGDSSRSQVILSSPDFTGQTTFSSSLKKIRQDAAGA
jgi:nucleoside-diphosphate-sugar epimerase